MRHFIFEDTDYEIKPQYRRGKKRVSLVVGLAALAVLARHKKNKYSGSGSGGIDKRQKCVVKMHYSYSKAAHIVQIEKYIQREGVGKDGSTPVLFGENEEEYKKNMTDKNFRIFLSPQNEKIPLETLAKTFIDRLEMQTGYTFYWVGAEHHNTAHPHVHILINGTDKKGEDVFINRDVVKTYMRDIARDLCTSIAGERTASDIAVEKNQSLTADRYTKVDTFIEQKEDDEHIVDTRRIVKNKEMIITRLEHLKKLGLCSSKDTKYRFEKGWSETLRTVGKYNSYLEGRNSLEYTNKHAFELYDSKMGKKTGIITKIFQMQEDSDAHAVILECIDGKAYFIPLFKKPYNIETSQIVTIDVKEGQSGRLSPVFTYCKRDAVSRECEQKGYNSGFGQFVQNGFRGNIER